jgi:integrase
MTWEAPKLRWRKLFHDELYTVSCKQLREQGYAVEADTKEGSLGAANLWWVRKESQIRLGEQPPPRPLSEVEKLVLASQCKDPATWEDEARKMDAAGITPAEMARLFAKVVQRIITERQPAGDCLKQHLPDRVKQLEHAAALAHGQAEPAPDTSLARIAERWNGLQSDRVGAGGKTARAAELHRLQLSYFIAFMDEKAGRQSGVADVNEEHLEDYYRYVLKRLKTPANPGGWSIEYAKHVFLRARIFIRYAAKFCPSCRLPSNIDDRFDFGSSAKRVTTWTPIEFQNVVDKAPGKLKLGLLLMANCGMTQKDVSDLMDDEVDWTTGTITRKRSKTRHNENVPTVTYQLWPRTFDLLTKYRSGTERVLLTESGLPYVREWVKPDGKFTKADGFASNYAHLQRRLKFKRPLKQLRKLGASLLAKHEVYGRFASYFLGHSPRTVADRHYVTPPQELFDEAVLWLGKQLGQVSDDGSEGMP